MSTERPEAADAELSLEQLAVRRRVGRLEADAQQNVRRLLDTGLALMQAGGNPRVADIVAASGLSNDAFYRYYKTKDDLVAAIVDEGAVRLLDAIARQMAMTDDPTRQLEAAVRVVMRQAADPAVAVAARNVFGNSAMSTRPDQVGKGRLERGLAGLLADPLERLGARDPHRDARAAAVLLITAMNHFLWREAPPSARDIHHLTAFLRLGSGTEGTGIVGTGIEGTA
ncbi:MAG: TetR family transcriptional regulator [Pseudonocardiales bacterium]|nr:TetR family transcriptional regulator [Pseudonocardiales bacterium]